MRRLALSLLLLLLTAGECPAGRIIDATVRVVYDGDTLLLGTPDGSRLKARLYGVDAPETAKPDKPGQPFGEASRRTLQAKVLGKRVSAEIVDIDQYRRPVAVIRHNGRDINREMAAEGMAWAYRQFLQAPYASEYLAAEERARAGRRGLWRDANPQPPWEFRRTLRGGRQHGRRQW